MDLSTSIQLRSGAVIDPLDPDPSCIYAEDIAHALSLQCRFSGHTRVHYSVAEHSVRVAWRCEQQNEMAGLMHDASEYILSDVVSPLKADPKFGGYYRECEDRLMKVIAAKFNFQWPLPDEVKKHDATLLATEVRDLLPHTHTLVEKELWKPYLTMPPEGDVIEPMSTRLAKAMFLTVFNRLSR